MAPTATFDGTKPWLPDPDEPEPQVTDPDTRERIREKIDADALDESGGPLPEDIAADEPTQTPVPSAPSHT